MKPADIAKALRTTRSLAVGDEVVGIDNAAYYIGNVLYARTSPRSEYAYQEFISACGAKEPKRVK